MEEKVRQFMRDNFGDGIVREDDFRGEQSFYIKKEYLVDVLKSLRDEEDLRFELLTDICSLDWLNDPEEAQGRFEVIYNLYSIKNKYRVLIKVRLSGENPEIDTVCELWLTANWLEREIWDLMGIRFSGHPDLTKIVTPDDLEGHPLRKDFPLTYEVPQFSWNKDDPPEVIT